MNVQQIDDTLQKKQDEFELLVIDKLINGYFRIYVTSSLDVSNFVKLTSHFYGSKLSIHWNFTSIILEAKKVMIMKIPELYDDKNFYSDSSEDWDSERDWDPDREGIYYTLPHCNHYIL